MFHFSYNNQTKEKMAALQTGIWIFQFFLESWKCRAKCVRKLEKHFVHDENGFLAKVRAGRCHLS